MPVVLKPEGWPAWLGEEPADPCQLKALLAPYPSDEMTCWLAGEPAHRQRQEQGPQPDRTDCGAMSRHIRHIWLAMVFVLLALTGCVPETAGQGSAPHTPSRDSGADIRGMQ
jgi:hypothetical protein